MIDIIIPLLFFIISLAIGLAITAFGLFIVVQSVLMILGTIGVI